MNVWTREQQQRWKSQLKKWIKSSGQTQAEVAKNMAHLVGEQEGARISENAFVTPLSRFVNAKGSEIHRWFELEQARLKPLSQALRIESVSQIQMLRSEVLLGKVNAPRHDSFPGVEWNIDWVVDGISTAKVLDGSNSQLTVEGCCVFTKSLIQRAFPSVTWIDNTIYTTIGLPSWKDVKSHIRPSLSLMEQHRLDALPVGIWTSWGFDFGDGLTALHILLQSDACWALNGLQPQWTSLWIPLWCDFYLKTEHMRLSIQILLSESGVQYLWNELGSFSSQGTAIEVLSQKIEAYLNLDGHQSGFNPEWLTMLKSDAKNIQKALRAIEEWHHSDVGIDVIHELVTQNLFRLDEGNVCLKYPKRWVFLGLQSSDIEVHTVNLQDPLLWSTIWWSIQQNQWSALSQYVASVPGWERSMILFYVWTEPTSSVRSVSKTGLTVSEFHWGKELVQEVWDSVLLTVYSGLNIPCTQIGSEQMVVRLHQFSKLFMPCLDTLYSWERLLSRLPWPLPKRNIAGYPLVYLAPYQCPPQSIIDWERLQFQSAVPLWRVLEQYALMGHQSSALLLAQGEGQFSSIWEHVPVQIRLSWLAKTPSTSTRLYLFQHMLLEYWQDGEPDLNFVLEIAQRIGFDTVLNWMQGWLNPLFLAQHTDGQILGDVAFKFAEHFKRIDLIEQWTRMLWNWIRSSDAIQHGFVHWNSRRVPIADTETSLLFEKAYELLVIGNTLSQQGDIMRSAVLDFEMTEQVVELVDIQKQVLRRIIVDWKRILLCDSDAMLLQRWIDTAPKTDLDVDRAVLDKPLVLTHLWRLDKEGVRRSEILQLSGLIRPIPHWAIAYAQRHIVQTGYWPTWLSPYTSDVSSLISYMLENSEGGDRLWWLKIYTSHMGVTLDVWESLTDWFDADLWKEDAVRTVHFLGPNQTPKVNLGDVLSWLRSMQKNYPQEMKNNIASRFFQVLQDLWQRHLSNFSMAQVVALRSILLQQGFSTTLWSLEVLDEHWDNLTTEVQQVVRRSWLSSSRDDFSPAELLHPIAGAWSLEHLIMTDFEVAKNLLRQRLAEGSLEGLSAICLHKEFSPHLIDLLEYFLNASVLAHTVDRHSLVMDWLWDNEFLLRHRQHTWQVWLTQWLSKGLQKI